MTIRTPIPAAGRKRVFDSVFPSSRLKDLAPTPASTPVLGQREFEQSFGGPSISPIFPSSNEASDAYPEQIVWDRAWHSATSFLTLPGRDFVLRRQQRDLDAFATYYNKPSKSVVESIRYVVSAGQAERGRECESLVEWYRDHVRGHFLAYSRNSLLQVSSMDILLAHLTHVSNYVEKMLAKFCLRFGIH
jgi:anaphase-promoting complex subunit 2